MAGFLIRNGTVLTMAGAVPAHFTPTLHGRHFNAGAHLVVRTTDHDVDDVWCDGRMVVAGGRLLSVDEATVVANAGAAADELFARRDRLVDDG